MDHVRIGVVGLGGMGSHHVGYLKDKAVAGASLGAICDSEPAKLERHKGLECPKFDSYVKLLDSKTVDAVLIATPHYQHCEIARAAFDRNIHVLSEKPQAVSVSDARQTNDAYAKVPHLKYGIMFQQRTNPLYQKLRQLIAEGELGEIYRVTWLITDWFRTHAYYASGGWRATWAGEGGGVLINQCPHNLDLIWWVTGIFPNRVTAVATLGKRHPIETEDEVSAILEYPNGAVGHFITTTGEAPGTNRLEIAGDRGKFVMEDGKLTFFRTRKSVREVNEKSPESFAHVETWPIDVPPPKGPPESHRTITQNFVNAITKGEALLSPGVDGVKGLELGNAMLMSGVTRKSVDLPLDGAAYDSLLKELAAKYGGQKRVGKRDGIVSDLAASFAKA